MRHDNLILITWLYLFIHHGRALLKRFLWRVFLNCPQATNWLHAKQTRWASAVIDPRRTPATSCIPKPILTSYTDTASLLIWTNRVTILSPVGRRSAEIIWQTMSCVLVDMEKSQLVDRCKLGIHLWSIVMLLATGSHMYTFGVPIMPTDAYTYWWWKEYSKCISSSSIHLNQITNPLWRTACSKSLIHIYTHQTVIQHTRYYKHMSRSTLILGRVTNCDM
jgi:hypothetical protein